MEAGRDASRRGCIFQPIRYSANPAVRSSDCRSEGVKVFSPVDSSNPLGSVKDRSACDVDAMERRDGGPTGPDRAYVGKRDRARLCAARAAIGIFCDGRIHGDRARKIWPCRAEWFSPMGASCGPVQRPRSFCGRPDAVCRQQFTNSAIRRSRRTTAEEIWIAPTRRRCWSPASLYGGTITGRRPGAERRKPSLDHRRRAGESPCCRPASPDRTRSGRRRLHSNILDRR